MVTKLFFCICFFACERCRVLSSRTREELIMGCYLAQGELIRLDGKKDGVVLRCTSGAIWLTCGDGQDYLLSAGKSFELAAQQSAVAEALQAAECTLGKPLSDYNHMHRPLIRLAAC
jgi:hypothetical protein